MAGGRETECVCEREGEEEHREREGFRVQGLRFRVWGLGFRKKDLRWNMAEMAETISASLEPLSSKASGGGPNKTSPRTPFEPPSSRCWSWYAPRNLATGPARGGKQFINSQTRPCHASEGNIRDVRASTARNHPEGRYFRMKCQRFDFSRFDWFGFESRGLVATIALVSPDTTRVAHPLGPLGFDSSQHGPTTRPSRRKDCRESIYAFGSRTIRASLEPLPLSLEPFKLHGSHLCLSRVGTLFSS